jgi:hypothetical protein
MVLLLQAVHAVLLTFPRECTSALHSPEGGIMRGLIAPRQPFCPRMRR